MDRYRSVRVTSIPKKTKYYSSSAIVPVNSKQQYQDSTHIQSPSHITPLTMSHNAFELPSITMSTIRLTTATNPMLRWNSTGIIIAGIGGSPGSNASQFQTPVDIALGSSNTFYIIDYLNHRVQYWKIGNLSGTTVAGQASASAGTTAAYLSYPTGLYVDSNDNIYVSDSGIAGSANNQRRKPYGIVQDPSTKTLYIADYNNHRVMSYTEGASMGTMVAGSNRSGTSNIELYNPVGIYLDSFTNSLVIANFGAHNIVRWVLGASSWTLVAGNITGSSGNSSTTLYSPTGVTLDPMGNVYVADALNSRIQFFMSGQSEGTTIVGITNTSGSSSTQLSVPYTVRLDSQLNLYVVDMGYNRILKFLRY
ncbi:unnamed protein product [Rotaria sordida]|uniref:NHL repeat containing protein n=1 Tax=Rotaria sordida TaxID=392033 RepID=A0A818Y2N4_9BILA|nr:unnamed protein product [Rotaria sordida]CAF3744681.1 unnamed protein product [Rotaria sordida]